MQTIQIIVQRMMWASCFCLALTLYHVPTRALPIKLGEATELHSGKETTYPAQRLGTEVSSMIKFQNAYVLTRVLNQGCQENHCPQTKGFNPSLIEPTPSESIR